jgi:hypothetical protein
MAAGTRNIETRSKLRLEIRRRVERVTFWIRRDENTPALVEDPASDLFPFAEVVKPIENRSIGEE